MALEPAFSVKVEGAEVVIRSFAAMRGALPKHAEIARRKSALTVYGNVLKKLRSGHRYGPGNPNPTNQLGTGTGGYRRSWDWGPKTPADYAIIGTPSPQAIHETGGTITAKGKYLAIPLTNEAQKIGSPRRFPRELFPFFSRMGSPLLVESGSRDRLKPQYVLKHSVEMPARPHLGPAFDESLPDIEGFYDSAVNGAIEKG